MGQKARYSKNTFQTRLEWQDLDPDYLRQLVGLAKIEDLAGAGLANRPERLGDVTTALMPEGAKGKALLTAREPLAVCGLGLVQTTLDSYGQDCQFKAKAEDGQSLDQGDTIGILSGSSTVILQAERVILNFLQHLSGVATEARHYVDALGNSPSVLLDTRKTLPGYRVLQKYAFACGGGYNHRIGLFDRVMLKDNHLAVAGATEQPPKRNDRSRCQYLRRYPRRSRSRYTRTNRPLARGWCRHYPTRQLQPSRT